MPVVDVSTPLIRFTDSNIAIIEVSTSSALATALDQFVNGGIIYLRDGIYGCLDLSNRIHKREAPLVLKGITDSVVFQGDCSYTININQSSYIAIKNVAVMGGLDGVKVRSSNHIILDDLDISKTRQSGFNIGVNSADIDVINSTIYDTGTENPQWGECIYVGSGGSQNFPDATKRVWIENNTASSCGFAEAINIKAEVFNSTVRGNLVQDIIPGSTLYSQHNQSAITVEGGKGSDPSNNYRPTQARNIWVENNIVKNVTEGRWNNGIMVSGTGVYVISNHLINIDENAIRVNNWGDLGLPAYIFDNLTNSTGGDISVGSGVNVITQKPSSLNPNKAQNWLPR